MRRSRRLAVAVLAALGLGRSAFAADSPTPPPKAVARPNVVIIMADDMGYGDLGCYGATKVSTPNCDRLAKEGRRFTDAHTPAATCSPSRLGLLTGYYPWRENRMLGNLPANASYTLHDGEPTIGGILKGAGYTTGCVGKWHLGVQAKRPVDWNTPLTPGPNTAGFDYYFGVINSHNLPPFVLVENDKIVGLNPGERVAIKGEREQTEGRRLRDENALEANLAGKAVEFIEQNKNNPFFLYYAAQTVHDPYTPGKAWQGKSQAGIYGDYVMEFDWAVGQVLSALDRNKLADNTIVIVTSDNGAQEGRGAEFGHKANGDLRGCKGTAWEGGHRLPFILRWPGKVPAGTTSDQTIGVIDCMATLCAALEIPLPPNAGPDSYNVLPAWVGEPKEQVREALISMGRSVYCIRKGSWTLLFNGTVGGRTKGGFEAPELYDLAKDPAQKNNLIGIEKEKEKELRATLERYRAQGYSRAGWKAGK